MSSRLLPLVSGSKKKTKIKTTPQTPASIIKNGPQPILLEVDKKVDAMRVATIRLVKVAIDIPLARMLVGKISDGMSQATGPIPMLNRARYRARPMITNVELRFPTNEKLIKTFAAHMPAMEALVWNC